MRPDKSPAPAIAAHCRRLLEEFGDTPLYTVTSADGSRAVLIDAGYVPLCVNYTHEDKEAKGLRSLKEERAAPIPAVHFTALEQAASDPLLMLLGERGSGKTTFALHVALNLAGQQVQSTRYNVERLRAAVPRNGHGHVEPEQWSGESPVPVYLRVEAPGTLHELLDRHWPEARSLIGEGISGGVLLIVDEADRLGDVGQTFLDEAAALASAHPGVRILIAGESGTCRNWIVPPAFRKYSLMPPLASQYNSRMGNPGLNALALQWQGEPAGGALQPQQRVERWLTQAANGSEEAADAIVQAAFNAYANGGTVDLPRSLKNGLRESGMLMMLEKTFLQCLLAARHLDSLPDSEVANLFHAAPMRWSEPISVVLRQRIGSGRAIAPVLEDLVTARSGQGSPDSHLVGAVLAAGLLAEGGVTETMAAARAAIAGALLHIVEEGRLAIPQRAEAGRHLARLGDPRDLEALVPVKGGRFTMGSPLHPNSTPAHEVTVGDFSIGMYPVTNRLYLQFIEVTGRHWLSQDGRKPERANSPAVDLTWHDARACCDWLTERWRASGKIGAGQLVRLATEPEWEYAARGPDSAAGEPDQAVYSWPGAWAPDHSNSEEAGFNDTCPVGIFPKGRSPWGCYDMCGQIWEWTTTLWGDDMATPSWKYPYADDGREDLGAAPRIRRVLRGGCFSSNKDKACCTYRGSLEPAGFWRGNGFRIVVS